MKKIVSIILLISLILTACSSGSSNNVISFNTEDKSKNIVEKESESQNGVSAVSNSKSETKSEFVPYKDYMDYYRDKPQVGESYPDDDKKIISREAEGEFVKTVYEAVENEDGSHSNAYSATYIWELEEYVKISNEKRWVVKNVSSALNNDTKERYYRYRDLDNNWIDLEPGAVTIGSMDIQKLIIHYYVLKTRYPERASEIPEEKLNSRKFKIDKDAQPKIVRESLAAIEKEREDFYKKQEERNANAEKGTYLETIKSYQSSLEAHKEYLEEAKRNNDTSLIKTYEEDIQNDINKIEIYSLLQQYIIEEDPNTNQELIKKWNLTKLTGDDRYLYYNKTEPLKIADGFEIYEDKTEFSCYYDDVAVDANGKRNRVYCRHKTDKNVKTNLDPNRYVVENIENIAIFGYRVYDKNPIYTITHIRDDMNFIFNAFPAPSRIEMDNQVFEFKYNCPFGVPINGHINFNVTFDPHNISQYTLKKMYDGKLNSEWKDDYHMFPESSGINTHYSSDTNMKDDDRNRYQQGDNTFMISNTTRRKQLLNDEWEKYYDSVNADDIKVKEIEFMISSYYKNFHGILDSN